MAVFRCKMCGGDLDIAPGSTVCQCEYCGTKQTLPKMDDERRLNMYDRANHFRRANEFDKAMTMYERILEEDKTDSEAYWSIVLCRYGIEYVEDPLTSRRIPTVNRAQFTSIFMDEDYKSALKYADARQRAVYEQEAKAIDDIQKGILAISRNEKPFDVFICYKETGSDGRRTRDSVLANDLYHQLTQEGFKVFFSRITLEDKLGQEYEPYIFAALNSAKVMVVLGTKPEYFNAVWVKNEWSRFLMLIKKGEKKTLIPAYRDMDPYDLPDEFSHLQAQDMSKLGFMQDLIRGIKKLTQTTAQKPVINQTVITPQQSGQAAPLLRRAFMFLEDGDFNSADEYCEKVLDLDPENARAYLGKLCVEYKAHTPKELHFGNSKEEDLLFYPISDSRNYQKVIRFGDEKIKAELEKYSADNIEEDNRIKYEEAKKIMDSATTMEEFDEAMELFDEISFYSDSKELAEKCEYESAIIEMETTDSKYDFIRLAKVFVEKFSDYPDSKSLAEKCNKYADYASLYKQYIRRFNNAKSAMEYEELKRDFETISGYRDADIYAEKCQEKIIDIEYKKALKFKSENNMRSTENALSIFESIPDYKNSKKLAEECRDFIASTLKRFIIGMLAVLLIIVSIAYLLR